MKTFKILLKLTGNAPVFMDGEGPGVFATAEISFPDDAPDWQLHKGISEFTDKFIRDRVEVIIEDAQNLPGNPPV